MKPIPVQMLQHTVRLVVPDGVGVQQNVTSAHDYYIHRTCLQDENTTVKATDNTAVNTNALLFVDARLSYPRLDWWALKMDADSAGGDLVVHYGDRAYTVVTVKRLLDNYARLHHYEVAMI